MTQPTILLVDDDASLLELGRIHLERLGYVTLLANSAERAIDLYQAQMNRGQAPDAAIIDLRLSGQLDGTALAQRLLDLHPEARLIISTGDVVNPAYTQFRDYGFCAALEKTFDRQLMREVLSEVLDTQAS